MFRVTLANLLAVNSGLTTDTVLQVSHCAHSEAPAGWEVGCAQLLVAWPAWFLSRLHHILHS